MDKILKSAVKRESKEKEIFHVHTKRCGHAENVLDEIWVKKAIELGANRIVFTDHAPFPGDRFTGRMKMRDFSEYIDSINCLKSIYREDIEVLCGLEIEYLPSFDEYIHSLRDNKDIDVMVLGQHFYEVYPFKYSFECENDRMDIAGYIRAMIQGIESNCFDVVAHPDRVFRYSGKYKSLERYETDRLIETIKNGHSVLLEKNYASMNTPNFYWKEFWRRVPRNINIIYGYDAHSLLDIQRIWEGKK